jgi:flavocytochrome c
MTPENVPSKWDYESDVLIVGGGTAGLPAGIKVREAGFKATVLEAGLACGGSLGMIAGAINFAGTKEQIAAGVNDSPDVLYNDLVTTCGADPEIARAYADNQIEAYEMIKAQGVETYVAGYFSPGHGSRRGGVGPPFGRGPIVVKAFVDRAKAKGVEILYSHRAQRLIINPQTGRVIGLKVDVKGETKYFKARKAVILATGGFGRNREMIAEYAPQMLEGIPKMPKTHRGDGLKMALDLGAATKDICTAVAGSWPICAETHAIANWVLDHGGIMVNIHGKRFYNEASVEGFYGRMSEAGMKQPGGLYWVIFDENINNNIGYQAGIRGRRMDHVRDVQGCKQYIENTLESLAEKIGVNAEGLKETINKYNSDIDTVGYDTVFGRKSVWGLKNEPIVKITPPFRAIKCVTAITSMKGGLKINGKGQVINNLGEVIPGLYAGGEVTGGLWTKSYLMGLMTTQSMAQGIVCGVNAAKESVLT